MRTGDPQPELQPGAFCGSRFSLWIGIVTGIGTDFPFGQK